MNDFLPGPSSDSVDDALRAMLRDRAADISTLPPRIADLDAAQPGTATRRIRWQAPLAAAAVVAAVSTVAVVLGSSHHSATPATPTTPHVTTPHVTTPPATESTHPTVPATVACQVAEPAAWRTALTQATTTAGAYSAAPLAVYGDQVLVSRDLGSSRDLALLGPDGTARPVYQVPDPDQNQVLSAAIWQHWLVVPVEHDPRGADGVDPTVVRIDVVDLGTDAMRTVTTAPLTDVNGVEGRTIDGATITVGANGQPTVFYDVRRTYTSTRATIHAYDVNTGTDSVVTTTVGPGDGEGPVVTARGLFWAQDQKQPAVPANLPEPVRRALTTPAAQQSLVSDGTDYSWLATARTVGFWAPGMTEPRLLTLPSGKYDLLGVGGRLVGIEQISDQLGPPGPPMILDERSPSSALTEVDLPVFPVVSDDKIMATATATAVVRIDPAELPALHC